jgi:hypothetical protein
MKEAEISAIILLESNGSAASSTMAYRRNENVSSIMAKTSKCRKKMKEEEESRNVSQSKK